MKELILISLLLFNVNVFAVAAKVLFTAKKVVANRNGSERVIARGAVLEAGDQIITAADAAANIQYTNGTLVNIGASSNYKILAYAPNQADTQIKAELNKGKIEIKTTGKTKETLKTPIVSLAILGTQVQVYVPSSQETYVHLTEGVVAVREEIMSADNNNSNNSNSSNASNTSNTTNTNSVRVTVDGIVDEPFPAEGIVNSPENSPGKIEPDTSIGVTMTNNDIEGGASSAGETVGLVNTSLVVGTSTSAGEQAVESISALGLAEISLICNP